MTKKICKAYAWAIARCHTGNLKESQVKIGGLHSKRVILNLLCKKLIPYLIVWMANKSVVREYFSLLEKTLDRLNIKDINSWAYLQLRWMSLDPKKEKGKKKDNRLVRGTISTLLYQCSWSILTSDDNLWQGYPSGVYTVHQNALYAKSPKCMVTWIQSYLCYGLRNFFEVCLSG